MNDHWIDELALSRGGKVGKIRKDAFEVPRSGGTRLPPESSGQLVQTLVIDGWTPTSLNKTMFGSVRRRIRIMDECHELVAAEAFRQRLVKASGARQVQVSVIFREHAKRPDPGNLRKVLEDSLVGCGLLLGDTYELCTWLDPIYYLGTKQTRIELTDIEAKEVRRWTG